MVKNMTSSRELFFRYPVIRTATTIDESSESLLKAGNGPQQWRIDGSECLGLVKSSFY